MGGGWPWGRGHPKVTQLPSVPPCTPGWGLGDRPCPSPVGDTMAPCGDKGHLGSPICLAPSRDTSSWGEVGGGKAPRGGFGDTKGDGDGAARSNHGA